MGSQAFTQLDPRSSFVPFSLPMTLPSVEHQLCFKDLPSTNNLEVSLSSLEPIAADVEEAVDDGFTSPGDSDQGRSEQLSPATPPDKLKTKVAHTSGPWSKTPLAVYSKQRI